MRDKRGTNPFLHAVFKGNFPLIKNFNVYREVKRIQLQKNI